MLSDSRLQVGKKERVEFAFTVQKYDRRFKVQKRDLLLSSKAIYIVGRDKEKKGPNKGQLVETVKRRIELSNITHVSMSTKQDDFVVLHVSDVDKNMEYDSLLQVCCVCNTTRFGAWAISFLEFLPRG